MSDRLRTAAIACCALGLAIAGYLTYVHYAGISPVCEIAHGCEKVQTSQWSELAGVPVALLGLIGYAGILAALLVRGEAGLVAAAGQAVIGFGFSAYLTYREVFTIDAICIWCVASAVLMAALAVITVARLLRADPPSAGATGAPGHGASRESAGGVSSGSLTSAPPGYIGRRRMMPSVHDTWERDGARCVWCSRQAWPRDRTVEHLLPRSRGGRDGAANLLPACRACNRARRSQAAAAYARQRVRDGRAVDVELLLRGLERLAAEGTVAERRYGAKQARTVRDWRDSEAALAAHLARATRA